MKEKAPKTFPLRITDKELQGKWLKIRGLLLPMALSLNDLIQDLLKIWLREKEIKDRDGSTET